MEVGIQHSITDKSKEYGQMRDAQIMIYDATVVGGGINGLCTLYHLLRLGCRSVTLIEQFKLGHQQGSSHGTSRITRSSYSSPTYVRLMQQVHNEEWPRLETDLKMKLLHPTPGCFWGPDDGQIRQYAEAVAEMGSNVSRLSPGEARIRFPMICFSDRDTILDDSTCALVDADNTIKALIRTCTEQKAKLLAEESVIDIDFDSDPIQVKTSARTLQTQKLAITTGPWASQLIPTINRRLTITLQTVGYFELVGAPPEFQVGQFPVWIYLGQERNSVFYGLPEFGRPGLKLARHITSGPGDTPEAALGAPKAENIEDLRNFLAQHFHPPIKRFHSAEHCLYTNTQTEDYILDFHPSSENVVIGAGFSGHGFKLGPLTGRILAEMLLRGKTTIPAFESDRPRFRLTPFQT